MVRPGRYAVYYVACYELTLGPHLFCAMPSQASAEVSERTPGAHLQADLSRKRYLLGQSDKSVRLLKQGRGPGVAWQHED